MPVVTSVEEAKIDQDMFVQMLEAMDKDGDGSVDKEEFKIPCAAALDRDCADRCLTRG